jgi:heat shock factor-binding protein 1
MDSQTTEEAATNKLNQIDNPEDLDIFVKELMDNMVSIPSGTWAVFVSIDSNLINSYILKQTRFSRLSDTILGRIDDMGSKIDDLEKSIGELMDQAGIEPSVVNNSTAAKGNPKA